MCIDITPTPPITPSSTTTLPTPYPPPSYPHKNSSTANTNQTIPPKHSPPNIQAPDSSTRSPGRFTSSRSQHGRRCRPASLPRRDQNPLAQRTRPNAETQSTANHIPTPGAKAPESPTSAAGPEAMGKIRPSRTRSRSRHRRGTAGTKHRSPGDPRGGYYGSRRAQAPDARTFSSRTTRRRRGVERVT